MKKLAIIIPIFILFLTACNDSIIYTSQNSVYSADLKNAPPGEAINKKVIYSLPNSNYNVLSLSLTPGGIFAAIGIYDSSPRPRNHDSRIIIINVPKAEIHKVYTKSDLIDLLDYPVNDASIYFMRFEWKDEHTLIWHAQPQTSWIESVPYNVSVEMDIRKNTIENKVYTARNEPFGIPLPNHDVKNKYTHSVQNGFLIIENERVLNLSNVTNYDVIFNSN